MCTFLDCSFSGVVAGKTKSGSDESLSCVGGCEAVMGCVNCPIGGVSSARSEFELLSRADDAGGR
jgi:hypothetical protein